MGRWAQARRRGTVVPSLPFWPAPTLLSLTKQVISGDVILQGGWTLTPANIFVQLFDTAHPAVILFSNNYPATNNFFEDLGSGGVGVTYQYSATVTAPGYATTVFLSNTLLYT